MMMDADFITDNFVRKLSQRTKPSLAFKAKTRGQFTSWQKELKEQIRRLLGEWPEPADLKPDLHSREEKEKYIREKWVIQTEKDCYMPLYLLIPKGLRKKSPAIVCCHGHGEYGKDPVAGVDFNDPKRKSDILLHNYNYGEQMAEKGFVTICPDWRSFGERVGYLDPFPGRDKCNVHFLQHLILGRTLLGANIFDAMRAIDFLISRKEVDPERIGCMGLSFGGTMTAYVTLLDERIKAADIICYATTIDHITNKSGGCGSQLVPHLYKYADVGDVIAAIAPRPLLIESGASDKCFYLHSARKAHEIARKAYKVAEAEKNLWIEVFPGAHSFSGRKAFDFFEKMGPGPIF